MNKNNTKDKKKSTDGFPTIQPDAAGIDIGSASHFVAVPIDRDEEPVKEFLGFTDDLNGMVAWLKKCKITTVAMEATGVYWIPVYEILEQNGFEVKLVNARHLKNVSGRKTDVLDCQWIQRLHSCGLLDSSFRPEDQIVQLRGFVRQRSVLVEEASSKVQHMHKALALMNVQLKNVISDITGATGMKIIRAIVAGERNPANLATHRDINCKNDVKTIEKSLRGNYRLENVFSLKQALEIFDVYQTKIQECDQEIAKLMASFEDRRDPEKLIPQVSRGPRGRKTSASGLFALNLQKELIRVAGVNITEIPGVDTTTGLKLISEIGLDMSRWKTTKHFVSWLGLCPNNKVSGGKRLSGRTKPVPNRAAISLRIAASTLYKNKTALGAFLRRLKGRLGPAKAITATAHKMARQLYVMLKTKTPYAELGNQYYEERYRDRVIKNLKKRAEDLGLILVPKQSEAVVA